MKPSLKTITSTFFSLSTMLGVCSTNFLFIDTASAQYTFETQQILNDTNNLIRESNDFVDYIEQQNQIEKNRLQNACNAGNTQACNQLKIKLDRENRNLDRAIERQRNINRCGSPVCY